MWAYNSVFYQIYPIGFCGAPVHNDGECVPRILKLMDWSEYLGDLGVDSILLNPIFESDNHGYDTRDFKKIDCRLGTNEDFTKVCRSLHEHGVNIVLDGVFNHVGRGFWAFKDVQEKRWDSPYKDWFHINFDGNSGYNDGFWYEGWEGHYELVKLNLQNPAVVDYLLDCVRFWVDEFDIDGLRLDVAYSLDRGFMQRLRSFVQELKPDFALIGEVLFGDYNLIVNDSMLHSCTNYECYKGLYSSFNSMNLFEIAHSLHRQFGADQWCIYRGKHLMTFADNHDVTRLASILTNKKHIPLAYGLMLGMPGIPCLAGLRHEAQPALVVLHVDDHGVQLSFLHQGGQVLHMAAPRHRAGHIDAPDRGRLSLRTGVRLRLRHVRTRRGYGLLGGHRRDGGLTVGKLRLLTGQQQDQQANDQGRCRRDDGQKWKSSAPSVSGHDTIIRLFFV